MNNLRPDEQALISENERSRSTNKLVKKGVNTAIGAGTAAAGFGTGIASRILPFLNEFIPADLAMKGINKISPQLGSFLKKGMEKGLDLNEGLNFIKDNINGKENKKEPAKQSKNIIEQESPELHQFIDQEIRKGRKPIEAAALAQNDKRFSGAIQKLMKAHKTPWSSIIESIFGKGNMGLPQQQSSTEEAMNPPGSQLSKDPQAAQTGQQQGNGANAIMQAIQMAAESRKRRQQ